MTTKTPITIAISPEIAAELEGIVSFYVQQTGKPSSEVRSLVERWFLIAGLVGLGTHVDSLAAGSLQ